MNNSVNSDADIKNKIYQSFEELIKNDAFLLINDVNERSLTHCLAVYLKNRFPEYDVDCEYNRDGIGTSPKKISKIKELETFKKNINPEDDDSVTVFPDIIIHKRGEQSGLVIIEAKKSNSGTHDDKEKLRLYKQDLGYPYAFFLIFPVKTSLENIDFDHLIEEIN